MKLDELKQIMTEKYPDVNFGEFSWETNVERENYWYITSLGVSKKDENVTTFYWAIVSDFRKFEGLQDFIIFLGEHINIAKYYFGELVLFHLDDFNNLQRTYTILIHSKTVLRPFSIINDSKEIWGYGIPGKVVVVTPRYQAVREYSEGLAAVRLNGKWGYIDFQGKEITPFIYDEVQDFIEDEKGCSINYIFHSEWSLRVFKTPQEMYQRYAAVRLNGKWGYVNTQGEAITPIQYDVAYRFYYDHALVKKDGKWGFINQYSFTPTGFKIDEVKDYFEHFTPVKYGDKWGYVTRDNRSYIIPIYDTAFPFRNNFAIAQLNGKWGYIDAYKDCILNLEDLDVETMSKNFIYYTLDEVVNAIKSKNVLNKLTEDSSRYS